MYDFGVFRSLGIRIWALDEGLLKKIGKIMWQKISKLEKFYFCQEFYLLKIVQFFGAGKIQKNCFQKLLKIAFFGKWVGEVAQKFFFVKQILR